MKIIPEQVIPQKIEMAHEARMAFWGFIKTDIGYEEERDRWIFNELYHNDTFDMNKKTNTVWFKRPGGSEGRNLDKFKKFCLNTGFSLGQNKQYYFSHTDLSAKLNPAIGITIAKQNVSG